MLLPQATDAVASVKPVEATPGEPLRVFLDSANMYCRPNGILSSRIYTYLQRNGHCLVPEPHDAQYVICNTCGFDGNFRGISLSLFSEYEKRLAPGARLVSVGCLNAMYAELAATHPQLLRISHLGELDALFFRRVKFLDIQEAYLRQADIAHLYANRKAVGWSERVLLGMMGRMRGLLEGAVSRGVPEAMRYREVMDEFSFESKAFVEIGSGCASNCSYCVIKKAKGPVVSRTVEAILKDIEAAREPGKSLCLVADDCGSYGLDLGESLPGLLRAIGERFPGLPIDILYLNPHWLEKQWETYNAVLAATTIRSVNIPIQTGSPRILSLMNRNYDVNRVSEIVRTFKSTSPRTLFITHVMVGFPSETGEDFRQTRRALGSFDMFWHFRYTDHEGTPAAALPDPVPEWLRRLRSVRLSLGRLAQHARYATRALVASARSQATGPER